MNDGGRVLRRGLDYQNHVLSKSMGWHIQHSWKLKQQNKKKVIELMKERVGRTV
jgi:uncharacterized C2H2 Zn-finger protein